MAPDPRRPAAAPADNAIAVISAYGAFRLLLVLLAIWSFFAGFSLFTQGVGALSFGSGSASAERVVGAQMLVLVPVYGLLAWRRDEYRLMLWIPYAAQLAIILPTLYDVFISGDRDFQDGALMLVVSLIFFVLLVYLWWESHPLDHFREGDEYEDEDEDADEEIEDAEEDYAEDEDVDPEESDPPPPPARR